MLASYPHTLSGGMARRVMLAIASVGDPDLVIADEPTNVADPDNAEKVFGFLRLRRRGQGRRRHARPRPRGGGGLGRPRAVLRDGALVAVEDAATFREGGEGLRPTPARCAAGAAAARILGAAHA